MLRPGDLYVFAAFFSLFLFCFLFSYFFVFVFDDFLCLLFFFVFVFVFLFPWCFGCFLSLERGCKVVNIPASAFKLNLSVNRGKVERSLTSFLAEFF